MILVAPKESLIHFSDSPALAHSHWKRHADNRTAKGEHMTYSMFVYARNTCGPKGDRCVYLRPPHTTSNMPAVAPEMLTLKGGKHKQLFILTPAKPQTVKGGMACLQTAAKTGLTPQLRVTPQLGEAQMEACNFREASRTEPNRTGTPVNDQSVVRSAPAAHRERNCEEPHLRFQLALYLQRSTHMKRDMKRDSRQVETRRGQGHPRGRQAETRNPGSQPTRQAKDKRRREGVQTKPRIRDLAEATRMGRHAETRSSRIRPEHPARSGLLVLRESKNIHSKLFGAIQ